MPSKSFLLATMAEKFANIAIISLVTTILIQGHNELARSREFFLKNYELELIPRRELYDSEYYDVA